MNCLRCGDAYVRLGRALSHFCHACRRDRNREKTAAGMRALRAVRADMAALVDGYVDQGIETDYAADIYVRIDDYIADVVSDDRMIDSELPLVPDRMPRGSNTPAGPNEGMSTTRPDLADALDCAAREAASHPWFEANPHWAYALHDPEEAALYLRDAA